MTSFRMVLIGLAALAAAGAALAAPGVTGTTKSTPSMTTPRAEPFQPYKPFKGHSPYGGDPTRLSPRPHPYESDAPGGFRPYRNGADDSDQGTIKRQGGTFGR